MKINKILGHLKNILKHKCWVFYYCCKLGIPWQGFMHDWSKFSAVEFWESVKYYQGDSSPIPTCKKIKGYSLAWLHHKGRNKHHYEYWIDYYDDKPIALKMPYKYVLEMLADWLAAGRTYQGSNWSIANEYRWWVKKRKTTFINAETANLIDNLLWMLFDPDGFKLIRKSKYEFRNNYTYDEFINSDLNTNIIDNL